MTLPDASPKTSEPPATTTKARIAFGVSIAAMTLIPLATTGTNLAFPEIEATFDQTTRSVLSWSLSGYAIVSAAFTLLGGQLSDRWDATRAFLGGLAAFAAGSLLTGLAPTAAVLILGRCLQGVGAAFIVPASLVLAVTEFPPERRPLVVAVWTAAFPIGSAAAPTLTALVLEAGTWRWVFIATAGLSVVLAVVIMMMPMRVAQPQPDLVPQTPDYLGFVVGTAGVALIALAIVQAPRWGWTSAATLGTGLSGLMLMPVFVRRSLGHTRPLMDLTLFRYRTFTVATLANIFISIAGTSVWLLWPLIMNNQWGYSQVRVGLAISVTPALAGTISVVSARWAQANGYRRLLVPGSFVLLCANVWYVVMLDAEPNYVGVMLPGLLMYGVGMGLTFAPVNAAALLEVPETEYGQANAGFNTIRSLASGLGIAAVIAAIGEVTGDPFVGYDRAFTFLAITSGAAVVLLAVAWPKTLAAAS